MRPDPWALAALCAYGAASLWLGDVFPFSPYRMYAAAAGRTEGAVPVFLAEDKPADVTAFEGFSGPDPDRMHPPGYPCSMEWKIEEAKRWVGGHRAAAGTAPGPSRVAWGFRIVSLDRAGRLSQRIEIVSEGRAWPRR